MPDDDIVNKPSSPDIGAADREKLAQYQLDTYSDLREDTGALTNHLLQVAGLGAGVGTYLLGTSSGQLKTAVVWCLILAVLACLTSGASSGFSFLFAQVRGERVLSRLGKTLRLHRQTRSVRGLWKGKRSADRLQRRWDRRIRNCNLVAAGSALLGILFFAAAAVLFGICR
jgi:hypothetical protein